MDLVTLTERRFMNIRIVEFDKGYRKLWKIEKQISFGWVNYYEPKDITFLSRESAEEDFNNIMEGKDRGKVIRTGKINL